MFSSLKKSNRVLGGILLVQVGLIALTWAGQEPRTVATANPAFPEFDAVQATEITIEAGPSQTDDNEAHKAIVLSKKGENWVVSSHHDYPADGATVGAFLAKLSGLQLREPIATGAQRQRQLKVDEQEFSRKVSVARSEGETLDFFVGDGASFRRANLRKAGSDEVFDVSGLATRDVAATVGDWIDRQYLQLDSQRVLAVEVRNAKGILRLRRDHATAPWRLEDANGPDDSTQHKDPEASGAPPLDQAKISELVRAVTQVSISEPVGTTLAPTYGLDATRVVLSLAAADLPPPSAPGNEPPPAGPTSSYEIGIGKTEGTELYLKAQDKAHVVLTAQASLKDFRELDAKALEAKEGADSDPAAPAMPFGGMGGGMGGLPPGFDPAMQFED